MPKLIEINMSKFAIIKLGSTQYNIEEGKTYEVPKFKAENGKMNLESVLAAGDEKGITLGKPTISKAKVEIEVLSTEKGEKVTTRIYKAKSRYRRTRGFRKQITKFKVLSINF